MKQVTISENIIRDLIPAYFSGTASSETMKLVDDFLKDNPDFFDSLDARAQGMMHKEGSPGRTELLALDKTRRLIRSKSIYMGFGIFFTLFPFSFSITNGEFKWLMGSEPVAQTIFLLVAAGCWLGHFLTRRKLKVTDVV